jgi:ADP-ribosyl-[dinitrogen reductase] hydrolase
MIKDYCVTSLTKRPIENSYIVPGTLLAAGEYPGSPPSSAITKRDQKLGAFLDVGITAFIDLTSPADRLSPYASSLAAAAKERQIAISYDQLTIPDMDVCDPSHMNKVLDTIDARIAEGRGVYVHCWGGIGRTGMVVGCWLVRHGQSGEDALESVNQFFRSMSPAKVQRHAEWGSPQTEPQRDVVRGWKKHDRTLRPTSDSNGQIRGQQESSAASIAHSNRVSSRLRDQMRGALIGLAVGDAVGTTVEFKRPGTFTPVTDMVGGGPFGLAAGEWTDDTSMALCLADSLIERGGFDAKDQMQRYVRWQREGYLSSNGHCFDIGSTVAQSLRKFAATGEPFAGSTDEMTAGNGSLMRLAPVPLFFFGRGVDAIALAGESSRTTHGAPVAVDACRYLAALILGALNGASKAELLESRYAPAVGYWDSHPLHPVIARIADGSFREKSPPAIKGTGYAADALEEALWAFLHSRDFREGCLLAVNLGNDADTTAAIYGQLAGAFYGEPGIPAEWRARIAQKEMLDRYAEQLFQKSFAVGDSRTHS